jgi:hypothetical protein
MLTGLLLAVVGTLLVLRGIVALERFGLGGALQIMLGLGVIAARFMLRDRAVPAPPMKRPCPHCSSPMEPSLSTCPSCKRQSQAWEYRDETWWSTGGDGKQYWLNERTKQWVAR